MGKIAPSGVAALGDRSLAICGVVSGRLDRYDYDAAQKIWTRGLELDDDCRYGVTRLSDGRLAVAGSRGIRVIARPVGRIP